LIRKYMKMMIILSHINLTVILSLLNHLILTRNY